MKNLHIIPTNDPSKLIKNNLGYGIVSDAWKQFDIDLIQAQFQNIYITSSEEIKGGDWVFDIFKNACPVIRQLKTEEEVLGVQKTEFKIILTDNKDLIKDGVQAIDDEFLEWFVKNPSCENIKVNPYCEKLTCQKTDCNICCQELKYKIIIPQEEPKQKTIEEAADLWSIEPNNVHPTDSYIAKKGFLEGAKSDAARDYWFSEFKKK
jgi:hypothetical protein